MQASSLDRFSQLKGLWYSRRQASRPTPTGLMMDVVQPLPRRPRVGRGRSRSKQLKDQVHQAKWLERTRLFQEAIHGRDESRGEMVASSNSEPLAIERADVLVDPRIHDAGGYIHPALRREPIVIRTQDIMALKRKSEAIAKPEPS